MVSLRGMVVNGPDKENDFYTVAPSILIVNYIIIRGFIKGQALSNDWLFG